MRAITDWIRHHQITAFFLITFGITFGLWFSFDAVMNQGKFFLAPFAFIAICGPALAGIIVSAISNPQPRQGRSSTPWIAFFVAWGVSLLVFLANNIFINNAPLSTGMVVFTAVAVAPVAFVISTAYSRIPGVKRLMASLTRLRGVWGWALLALVFVPGLALLAALISSAIGRQPFSAHNFPETGPALVGLIAVTFLYQLFFFNATGEEAGWRGFALPNLQSRTSPLIASLILASFWGIWHFFAWQAEGKPVLDLGFWIETYVGLVPATLVIVWICNRAKGSILVVGITHAAANTAFAFLPNLDWPVYNLVVAVAALVMILIDRMWQKLPSDHPAVVQLPGKEPIGTNFESAERKVSNA
jgi:membrane protease YdiL (CAAX protease family)